MEYNWNYTIISEDELKRLRFRIADLEEHRNALLNEINHLESALADANDLVAKKTQEAENAWRQVEICLGEIGDIDNEAAHLRRQVQALKADKHGLKDEARKLERDAATWKKAYEAERASNEFLQDWDLQQKILKKTKEMHEEEYRMRLALQEQAAADHNEMRGLRAEVEECVHLKDLAEEAAGYWRKKYRDLEKKHEDDPILIDDVVEVGDMERGTYGWAHPEAIIRGNNGFAAGIRPLYWAFPDRGVTHRVAIFRVTDTLYRVAEEIETDGS